MSMFVSGSDPNQAPQLRLDSIRGSGGLRVDNSCSSDDENTTAGEIFPAVGIRRHLRSRTAHTWAGSLNAYHY